MNTQIYQVMKWPIKEHQNPWQCLFKQLLHEQVFACAGNVIFQKRRITSVRSESHV